MGAINVGGFSHFDQAFLLDISGYVTLQNTNFQNMPKKKTNRRLCLKIQFSAIFT